MELVNRSLRRRLVEVFFVTVVAFSLYLLVSLATYQIRDNFAFSGTDHIVNAGGVVGAWLSRALFIVFGYVAYSLPLFLSVWAYSLLKEPEDNGFRPLVFAMRSFGFVMFMLALCGIASIQGMEFSQILPVSAGGVLGATIGEPLYGVLNNAGSVLLLMTVLLVGLTLLTDVSWLTVVERVGFYVLAALSVIKRGLFAILKSVSALGTRLREQQALKREQKREVLAQAQREKPIIPVITEKPLPEISEKPSIPLRIKKKLQAKKEASTPFSAEESLNDFPIEPLYEAPKVTLPQKKKKVDPAVFKTNSLSGPIPSLSLLSLPNQDNLNHFTTEELEARSREVEQKLLDFGVEVQVVAVHPGPVITRFELHLAPGLKVSKITALGKDLARSLSVLSVRVVEVIPGKAVVGLELPNRRRDVVTLSEVLATEQYDGAKSALSLALGVDIAGHPVIVDLAKMPHLLVAGTTGSGKSVCINAMLLSLIFKATPDDVRLILVDPKMLELAIYEGIPHLLAPVVTDMRDAASALRWCVVEMERRYRLMASLGVRNISGFNHKVEEAIKKGEPLIDPIIQPVPGEAPPTLSKLPKIVVVIDELADMMMVVGKKVEQLIARIAQKARASGIHLILATQRPSVDVLTGLIKSNIPTRISFQVSSKIDSRTILDQQGAEQLLGQGDMLYLPPGTGSPVRVHGAFVDDNEVHRVVQAWREVGAPQYIEDITTLSDEAHLESDRGGDAVEESDPLYDEAVAFVVQSRKASISSVQRRFKIGYNRAARLIEEMERTGLVGPLEGTTREVLAPITEEN